MAESFTGVETIVRAISLSGWMEKEMVEEMEGEQEAELLATIAIRRDILQTLALAKQQQEEVEARLEEVLLPLHKQQDVVLASCASRKVITQTIVPTRISPSSNSSDLLQRKSIVFTAISLGILQMLVQVEVGLLPLLLLQLREKERQQ